MSVCSGSLVMMASQLLTIRHGIAAQAAMQLSRPSSKAMRRRMMGIIQHICIGRWLLIHGSFFDAKF
jgi:hypothetical protein